MGLLPGLAPFISSKHLEGTMSSRNIAFFIRMLYLRMGESPSLSLSVFCFAKGDTLAGVSLAAPHSELTLEVPLEGDTNIRLTIKLLRANTTYSLSFRSTGRI